MNDFVMSIMTNRPFYRYGGHLESIVLTEKLWAAEGAIAGKFIVYTAFRKKFLPLVSHIP